MATWSLLILVTALSIRILLEAFLLPPATKLQQDNVFTPVCHSVHRRGVSAIYNMDKSKSIWVLVTEALFIL